MDDLPAPEKLDKIWMIRDCNMYKEEYKECSSMRGRFHQKFTTGTTIDCSAWQSDYEDCLVWVKKMDVEAKDRIVAHEEERMSRRLGAALDNDILPLRTEPPADWNSPLPPHIEKLRQASVSARDAEKKKAHSWWIF